MESLRQHFEVSARDIVSSHKFSKNAQDLADSAMNDAKNIKDPQQRQKALRAAEEVAENVEAVCPVGYCRGFLRIFSHWWCIYF